MTMNSNGSHIAPTFPDIASPAKVGSEQLQEQQLPRGSYFWDGRALWAGHPPQSLDRPQGEDWWTHEPNSPPDKIANTTWAGILTAGLCGAASFILAMATDQFAAGPLTGVNHALALLPILFIDTIYRLALHRLQTPLVLWQRLGAWWFRSAPAEHERPWWLTTFMIAAIYALIPSGCLWLINNVVIDALNVIIVALMQAVPETSQISVDIPDWVVWAPVYLLLITLPAFFLGQFIKRRYKIHGATITVASLCLGFFLLVFGAYPLAAGIDLSENVAGLDWSLLTISGSFALSLVSVIPGLLGYRPRLRAYLQRYWRPIVLRLGSPIPGLLGYRPSLCATGRSATNPWLVFGLMVTTFGLYGFYWLFDTWRQLKAEDRDNRKAPVWHALSVLVPVYGFYRFSAHMRAIRDLARSAGVKVPWSPRGALVGWFVTGWFLVGLLDVPPMLRFTLVLMQAGLFAWAQLTLTRTWQALPGGAPQRGIYPLEPAVMIVGAIITPLAVLHSWIITLGI